MQRGSDELLSQAAVMAPASDNNNQDLATKKAKLDSTSTVLGGVGKFRSAIAFNPNPFWLGFSQDLQTNNMGDCQEYIPK